MSKYYRLYMNTVEVKKRFSSLKAATAYVKAFEKKTKRKVNYEIFCCDLIIAHFAC